MIEYGLTAVKLWPYFTIVDADTLIEFSVNPLPVLRSGWIRDNDIEQAVGPIFYWEMPSEDFKDGNMRPDAAALALWLADLYGSRHAFLGLAYDFGRAWEFDKQVMAYLLSGALYDGSPTPFDNPQTAEEAAKQVLQTYQQYRKRF